MARVRGFRGLRFTDKAGELSRLVCPPYDIVSEQERQALIARNPNNLIRLELPREGEDHYATAGDLFTRWMQEGILAEDEQEGLYIYEEEFTAGGSVKKIKGFFCLVGLEEFSKGVILPHEETLSKAKTDRLNLMKACGCNFSPIYSLYFDREVGVTGLIEELSSGEPCQQFTDGEGVTHRLWCVYDPAIIARITGAFEGKHLYIADGHHRYETAINYRNLLREQKVDAPKADYVMMTLVNMEHPGLVVFPTHRIVRGLEAFDLDKVLEDCRSYFTVTPLAESDAEAICRKLAADAVNGAKTFALCTRDGWYQLTLTDHEAVAKLAPDRSAAYCDLDVSVLHNLVLERIFKIDRENMANQKNLIYTRDPAEAQAAVASGEADCAFLLNPTRVEQVAAVAAAGDKMPQKSTYFYPKIITGAVMNKIR